MSGAIGHRSPEARGAARGQHRVFRGREDGGLGQAAHFDAHRSPTAVWKPSCTRIRSSALPDGMPARLSSASRPLSSVASHARSSPPGSTTAPIPRTVHPRSRPPRLQRTASPRCVGFARENGGCWEDAGSSTFHTRSCHPDGLLERRPVRRPDTCLETGPGGARWPPRPSLPHPQPPPCTANSKTDARANSRPPHPAGGRAEPRGDRPVPELRGCAPHLLHLHVAFCADDPNDRYDRIPPASPLPSMDRPGDPACGTRRSCGRTFSSRIGGPSINLD